MGFKDARAKAKENVRFQAMFEGHAILDGELRIPPTSFGSINRVPIGGAVADVDDGDPSKRTTVTRVATGAILAGPLGAIVGGILRKDTSRVYVTITLASGDQVIADAPKKDTAKARGFAAKVNAAGAWYAEHEFGDGSTA